MKAYRLALIVWEDSTSAGTTWNRPSEIRGISVVCYSAGWIIREDDRVVVIVGHRSPDGTDNEQTSGDITIPRGCIKHIYRLPLPARLKGKL